MISLLLLGCGAGPGASTDSGGGPPLAIDADQDGWTQELDCDDQDASVHPEAPELCNQVDDDCDARVDEGHEASPWYLDLDGDGYGDPSTQVVTCLEQEGRVELGTDCDDLDDSVHPGAAELCDGLDQDCDLEADEGLPLLDWWLDLDGDGYGDPAGEVEACRAPVGFVDNGEDCDDDDASAWPGAAEDWTDETDSDCDGEVETAGPVALTGGEVEQVHLTLPEGTALRVVSVQGPGTATLTVDLAQPVRLVLIGQDVRWKVVDLQGTVEEQVEVDADAVATTLDHPLFYDQRAAVESVYGPIASWHGTAALDLHLSDLALWPASQGWPDCEHGRDETPLGPATRAVLPCPELADVACLTATPEALVALDLDGRSCTVLALDEAPAGGSLAWSGATVLLTQGPHGVLSRLDLVDGARSQAWLWPQAVLHDGAQALLVPGEPWAGLDPDIAYQYASWGDLQCGDGSNLTGVWAADLAVSTLSMGLSWWAEDGSLLAWDLASGSGRTVAVAELSQVRGLSGLPDGTLALLVDGAIWVVDPMSGVVRQTVEVDVEGSGLACAGL